MRTTLDIDPDILQVSKEIAAKERCSAGAVLSKLARAGFQMQSSDSTPNGVHVWLKKMPQVRPLADKIVARQGRYFRVSLRHRKRLKMP